MKIDCFTDATIFETLQTEWNALLHRAVIDSLFLTHEWQTGWWHNLGTGELRVITFRDEREQLVGIAPLFVHQKNDGDLALALVGCVDVSDYLDLIVARGAEQAVYAGLLDFLARPDFPAWDSLDLCTVPADSPTNSLFKTMAEARGLTVEHKRHDVAPVIDLPDDWDTYLATLDKKQRHEIRRKLRRVEEANTRWYAIESIDELEPAVADFIELHKRSRPDKHMFMDERMQAFFVDMAKRMFKAGWLRLVFLEAGGERAAAIWNLEYNNDVLVYNSGYDPVKFGALSPGIVLFAHSIRDAIAAHRRRYDFLRGNEEYKYRFGAHDTEVMELHVRKK